MLRDEILQQKIKDYQTGVITLTDLIEAHIEEGDALNGLNDMKINVNDELMLCFKLALFKNGYNIAMKLFYLLNNLHELTFVSYDNSSGLEKLNVLLSNLFSSLLEGKQLKAQMLISILNHIHLKYRNDTEIRSVINQLYISMCNKNNLIDNWKILDRKFVECFNPDFNYLFFCSVQNDNFNAAAYLLKNKKLDLRNISWRYDAIKLEDQKGLFYKNDKGIAISPFQGVLIKCLPNYKKNMEFIELFLACSYDSIFRLDEKGNNIFHYFEKFCKWDEQDNVKQTIAKFSDKFDLKRKLFAFFLANSRSEYRLPIELVGEIGKAMKVV